MTLTNNNIYVFSVGVFAIGILCMGLRLSRTAYRYAGITLGVVMLIAHKEPVWLIAIHRFIEVSVGIVIGLAMMALWAGETA